MEVPARLVVNMPFVAVRRVGRHDRLSVPMSMVVSMVVSMSGMFVGSVPMRCMVVRVRKGMRGFAMFMRMMGMVVMRVPLVIVRVIIVSVMIMGMMTMGIVLPRRCRPERR